MKRIWIFCLLLAGTAVFLSACSGSQALATAIPTEVPQTAVPPTLAKEQPTSTSPASANDFSRIGQTGQPQFLNAYASW